MEGFSDLEVIGRGGSATVYRGWQRQFARTVAIKVFEFELQDDSERRRFERECEVTGSLSGHPYIVQVHGAGLREDGRPYIVMRHMAKGSLQDLLRSDRGMPPERVASIGIVIATALHAAHQRSVFHRDVKPANVLVSEFDEVALSDFGVAVNTAATATGGTAWLTPAHAPPEAFDGHGGTAASDLYSLGSTLYTLLSGSSPFVSTDGEGILSFARRVAMQPPERLDAPGTPPQMIDLIDALLAKEPEDRPGDAAAVAQELSTIEQRLGPARTPTPGIEQPRLTGEETVVSRGGPAARPFTPPPNRTPPNRTPPNRTPPPSDPATPSARPAEPTPPTPQSVPGTLGSSIDPGAGQFAGHVAPRWPLWVTTVGLVAALAVAAYFVSGSLDAGSDTTTTVSSTTSTTATTITPAPTGPPTVSTVQAPPPSALGQDSCGNPQSYEDDNMIDGDASTAWRMDGSGLGQEVTVVLAQPAVVTGVGLIPGHAKTDPCDGVNRFVQQRRITSVTWRIGDHEVSQSFADAPDLQTIAVPAADPVDRVSFTITGVTEPGDPDRDRTAISTVQVS